MVSYDFDLKIDGKKVDSSLISSLSFKDEIGYKSDVVTVDTLPNFTRPKPNSKVELILRTLKNDEILEELECGLFHVQTVTRKNNNSLSFSATAIEFSDAQKIKESKHYENIKLSSLIEIIGQKLGHKVVFDSDDLTIKSINQTNESALNFLQRLAEDYHTIFSIKNDYLYFVSRDSKTLPQLSLDLNMFISSSIKHSSKTYYQSCEATWHDKDKAVSKVEVVGSGKPQLKISGSYQSVEEARVKARARLALTNKGTVKASISMRGKSIYAGTKLSIKNTYNNEDDGVYSVVSCSHKYSRSGGWTVDVEMES
jgi:phage protein D